MLGLGVKSDEVVTGTTRLKTFTGAAKGADLASAGLTTTTGLLTKAMGFLGAALSVQQLINLTSAWTDLNSRIKNVVGNQEAAAVVMERIDDMARRTYSSLTQTAETYLLNAKAMQELGYSTNETLDFVESLNNALVVSGAKGERAEQVMNALSKAIGLGQLSGDNLNTVLATGGRVASALAEGLGVTTLELRQLGTEGKLTTIKVMEALSSQLEQLRDEADAMPATIQDAFTLLGNSIMTTVGQLDEATGASTAISTAIIALGDNINIVIPILGALAAVIVTAMLPALISATAAVVAFAASPIGILAITIGAVAAAFTYEANEQRLAAQAAKEHSAELVTNASAIEAARTASAGFRTDLRAQIEAQLDAAEAALQEAEAQKQAAQAKVLAQAAITDTLGAVGKLFGFVNDDMINERVSSDEASIMGKWQAQLTAAQDRVTALRSQLDEVDKIITTPPGDDDKKSPLSSDQAAALKKAKEGYDGLTLSTQQRTDALVAEAAALGMTDLAATSLKNTQELMAEAEKTGIAMTPDRVQEILQMADALTEADIALQGLQMNMDNEGPWETFSRQVENLDELMSHGAITAHTYWSEVGNAAEEMVSTYASSANDLLDNIESITDAMGLQGKEAFEVQKALSLARAVVAGGEAIVHSYNAGAAIGGPPVGVAFAAVAAAATAAQIASIASSTYTSTSASNSTGSSSASTSTETASSTSSGTTISLTLVGSGSIDIEDLGDQLAKSIADGGNQNLTVQINKVAA